MTRVHPTTDLGWALNRPPRTTDPMPLGSEAGVMAQLEWAGPRPAPGRAVEVDEPATKGDTDATE